MLNIYKEIEHLKELGIDPELAESIVKLHTKSDANLVTKADLKAELQELKIEMLKADNELKQEISDIKGDIKALNRDKILDRTLLAGIFLMMLGYLIKTFIH
jgi:hypothetical protein